MRWFARVTTVFVAGGLGGAALDQLHVRSGALSYPHPLLWGQPAWVAPEFGVGVLAIVAGTVPMARWAGRDQPLPSASAIALDAGWFLAAYGASALQWRHHAGALALALAVVWMARMAASTPRWRATGPLVATSVGLALGGCAYEGTLVATGAFAYAHPDVYHVPLWLVGIYLNGAPLALAATRRLTAAGVDA